mgnify:FL=1|jgi:hypothetical protein
MGAVASSFATIASMKNRFEAEFIIFENVTQIGKAPQIESRLPAEMAVYTSC